MSKEKPNKVSGSATDLANMEVDSNGKLASKTNPDADLRGKMPKVWFSGLNALRFFAAFTVVIMHMHSNLGRVGLPQLPDFPILLKGLAAVSFFFVLSGFLITYLLLHERTYRGDISVKRFYLRRVFRIWPLYFLVVGFGLVFYWFIVPKAGLEFHNEYPLGLGIALYLGFGANILNSLFHVGGMLHVTWSIAVEEQFYLFWAPAVRKYFIGRLPQLIAAVTLLSLTINIANHFNVFGLNEGWQLAIHTLQFHYMGLGAAAAYLLYYKREQFLNWSCFCKGSYQWLLFSSILAYFFAYKKSDFWEPILVLPLGLLFAWLIVNIGANPQNKVKLSNAMLSWLGQISYGIYMFHMIVVYFSSFIFQKLAIHEISMPLYFVSYFAVVSFGTILISHLSFKLLEKPILCFGHPYSSVQPGRLPSAKEELSPASADPQQVSKEEGSPGRNKAA